MSASKLPFELSSDDIAIWLNTIEKFNSAKVAVELNNAAKLLRLSKENSDQVLNALIQLTPAILHTCNTIETTFLSDPHSKKYPIKIIKLCIQLLKNMGLAFSNIEKQSYALYMALQLIGHSQRLSALFHESPSSSLWKETGQIYNSALKKNLTQQEIDHKIQHFKEQLNISSVLKRNILFNLFTPYKYSADQTKELFLLSNILADKLELNNTNTTSNNVFYWLPEKGTPPDTVNTSIELQQPTITIDTKAIITLMQSNTFICKLNKDTVSNLVDHLSCYQSIINKPIPSAPIISHLLIGFNNIIEHLTKVSTLQKIEQLSADSTTPKPTKDLSIQAKSINHDHLPTTPKIAYSSNYKDFFNKTKAVKTLRVTNENYIIAETSYLECNIGDISLLCLPNLTNQLGIIRQVKVTNNSKTIHILIEKINGILSTQLPPLEQNKTAEIISVQDASSFHLIFQAPCKLANGSKLNCASGDHFTLTKLTDYSLYFSLYQADQTSNSIAKN